MRGKDCEWLIDMFGALLVFRTRIRVGSLRLPPPTALSATPCHPRKKGVLLSDDRFRPFTLTKFPRWDGDNAGKSQTR